MPPGTVIRSFAAPGATPRGLAWAGRTLWTSDTTASLIYQIDPVTGAVIRSFASPGAGAQGITWDGRTLWHADNNTDLIYQIDPITGTVIRGFAAPEANPVGLTWDGQALWLSGITGQLIYQIDPLTGSVIRSFATPSTAPRGLAWDGHSLWLTDSTTDRIYQIDPVSGSVIRSFGAPNVGPGGLAWDGRTLWVADFTSDLIYQLSVTPGASYADRVIATGPIAYWPQWEAAGTISFDISGHSPLSERDGAYTGVTLGAAGIGDGRTSAFYDGANDSDDVFTANLAAAFDGDTGSFCIWARVFNVGVWTDGVTRYAMHFGADGNNEIRIVKNNPNNTLYWWRRANGVTQSRFRIPTTLTTWMATAQTWDLAADEFIAYLNGFQDGAIQAGLNAWANPLAANTTTIGALDVFGNSPWHGWLAHAALWDRVLSPAEVLSLGVL